MSKLRRSYSSKRTSCIVTGRCWAHRNRSVALSRAPSLRKRRTPQGSWATSRSADRQIGASCCRNVD